jgi:hypothetical protein
VKQKNNSVTSAETSDDSSTKDDVTTLAPITPNPMLAAVKCYPIKRFLLFFGDIYYPNGGMDDLLSDHDTIEEAMSAFEKKVDNEILITNFYYKDKKELLRFRWASIYDLELRTNVWSS